jgi:RimJ/RimL family protein N-acetyltransferase
MTLPKALVLHDTGPEDSGSDAQLVVRPAQLEDAAAMAAISIDRKADIAPGNPSYTAERVAWWREHGTEAQRDLVGAALANPGQYFVWAATVGEGVVGYAFAEAPPGDAYTHWKGMSIARGYDGHGVGRSLEFERRAWAQRIGRPVRALIVVGNNRSMDFFERQGFKQVGIREATPKQPLRFNIMELRLAALNGYER